MENRQHFPALTSLKGLFILIILFHNTFSITPLFENIPGTSFLILFGGILGNSMFFMLSGFLIANSYRKPIRTGLLSFKDFLLRRLRKLYPIYLVTNIVALLVAIAQYGMSAINLKKIAFTLLLQIGGGLENGNPYNSPTWFLSALFVCYILFFAISRFAKTHTQYCFTIAFGIIWGYTLLLANVSIPFCYSETGLGLMNFFIGCGLAELYPWIEQKNIRCLQPISILVLAASGYLLLRYGFEIIAGDMNVAFSFVICPLILYLALTDGVCSRLLKQKPFVWLGKISSSIFFWHLVIYFAFCYLLDLIVPGMVIRETQYVLYLILTIVCSVISSKYTKKHVPA